jgi:UDP-N-acetylglucosamine diphosphorylase / glucose-1-phosphate thymidylyltransferase / UDP-N-acetylgalactosamine diphosphorylase / glucosamine-1-phosphate N-acetyltransferase / galactosamine-1-phosphate N-acetyltransferase
MFDLKSFFELRDCAFGELFATGEPVWTPLRNLKRYMEDQFYPDQMGSLISNGKPLTQPVVVMDGEVLAGEELRIEYGDATKGNLKVYQKDDRELAGASVIMAGAILLGNRIRLGKGVLVEPGAYIKSPAIIGDRSEIRQGAYLRGHTLVGARCVVGHVTEVKHAIFLDDAKAGHFAYVGDSILGANVNLGAGTKLANLRFIKGEVRIKAPEGKMATGLHKLGAILGDQVQTGCNSVTNPGTLLGRNSLVLANTTVAAGYFPPHSVIR